MVLMIMMRCVRRCARLCVIHPAIRCRHAAMCVWSIHTHADGAERRYAHLDGEESERHGVPTPASSSHEASSYGNATGLVGSDPSQIGAVGV
jgi:hypothetical protein